MQTYRQTYLQTYMQTYMQTYIYVYMHPFIDTSIYLNPRSYRSFSSSTSVAPACVVITASGVSSRSGFSPFCFIVSFSWRNKAFVGGFCSQRE